MNYLNYLISGLVAAVLMGIILGHNSRDEFQKERLRYDRDMAHLQRKCQTELDNMAKNYTDRLKQVEKGHEMIVHQLGLANYTTNGKFPENQFVNVQIKDTEFVKENGVPWRVAQISWEENPQLNNSIWYAEISTTSNYFAKLVAFDGQNVPVKQIKDD